MDEVLKYIDNWLAAKCHPMMTRKRSILFRCYLIKKKGEILLGSGDGE